MRTDFTSEWHEFKRLNPELVEAGVAIMPLAAIEMLAEHWFVKGVDHKVNTIRQLEQLARADEQARELLGPPHLAHDFGLVFGH